MNDFSTVAREMLSRMNLREQAISEQYTGMMADMAALARSQPDEYQVYMEKRQDMLCAAYGFSGGSDRSKSFAFANGVAIIPISGTLVNRFGQGYSFLTGYNFIRAQHNAAMADPDVKMIVHDHNSYGGEAAGCFETSAAIAGTRGTKPILAVVDSNCYSASYALASAADKIIVTPSGGVGSIGVVAMHVDMSKMLDDWGIKITFIHSGDHKVDGNPYEALSKDVKADIQKGVDKSRAAFVTLVATNRGMDEKTVHDTQARTYRADDALSIGLIDAIAEPSAALQAYLDGQSDADKKGAETEPQPETLESPMTTETKDGAAPAAKSNDQAADAKTERTRISAILTSPEGKANANLANHLAFNSDMSAEAAIATLAAAGPATPPAKAEEPKKEEPAQGASAFEKHMNGSQQPNVGADSAANTQRSASLAAADSILSDFATGTGFKEEARK